MLFKLSSLIAISCIACALGLCQSPQSTPISKLIDQLQREETSDQATDQILRLGPNNSEARTTVAKQLPLFIAEGPKGHYVAWTNAVHVAGAFRLTEAIPGLIKWLGLPVGTAAGGTLAETARLDPFPAGKALTQMGDPAIPALAEALEKGTKREQWVAYRALSLIGSSPAVNTLREHLKRERDPAFKAEITKALEKQ